MRRWLLLWFVIPFCFAAESQNTIGLPEIINYTKGQYGAGTQNWEIQQGRNGIIYFANNEGLLSFDGTYWKVHSLPNKTNVRSVRIGADDRIYVGGQDEIGYFSPDARGTLQFTSLKHLIPAEHRSFADVWDIIREDRGLFFRSGSKIFQFSGNTITVYPGSDWRFMGTANGKLIAQDHKNELLLFQ